MITEGLQKFIDESLKQYSEKYDFIHAKMQGYYIISKKGTTFSGKDEPKSYISLDNEKKNYIKALKILFPIMVENNINTFLFPIDEKGWDGAWPGFAIYNETYLWLGKNGVLTKITTALKENEIKSGESDDLNFTLHPYIRPCRLQISKLKVSWYTLKEFGFTLAEAANISNSSVIQFLCFRQFKVENYLIKIKYSDVNIAKKYHMTEKIIAAYLHNIISSTAKLLFGNYTEYLHNDLFLGHFFKDADLTKKRVCKSGENPLIISSFLRECIGSAAAHVTCIFYECLSKDERKKIKTATVKLFYAFGEKTIDKKDKALILGDISSVVYYHFYERVIKHCQTKNIIEKEEFNNLFKTSNITKIVDKTKLIKEIVKCSFRDPNVDQIEKIEPTYRFGWTELSITDLVDRILDQYQLVIE